MNKLQIVNSNLSLNENTVEGRDTKIETEYYDNAN